METSRFVVDGGASASLSEHACVQQPDFLYLVGCVREGFVPGKLGEEAKPPFANCVAIDGLCGPTCGSGVFEPTYFTPGQPGYMDKEAMHCVDASEHLPAIPLAPFDAGSDKFSAANGYPRVAPAGGAAGRIRLDDVEDFELDALGLQPASYLFSVMYVMGTLSLFLMYVPSIGVR